MVDLIATILSVFLIASLIVWLTEKLLGKSIMHERWKWWIKGALLVCVMLTCSNRLISSPDVAAPMTAAGVGQPRRRNVQGLLWAILPEPGFRNGPAVVKTWTCRTLSTDYWRPNAPPVLAARVGTHAVKPDIPKHDRFAPASR